MYTTMDLLDFAMIRRSSFPQDAEAILSIDTSFTTDVVYRVEVDANGFRLLLQSEIVFKRYPVDIEELVQLSDNHLVLVASTGTQTVGFAAAEFVAWNSRAILHHLYIDAAQRKQGVGKRLVAEVVQWAATTPARCLWLETQNTNVPAIEFYESLGFSLCGFDTTLYTPEGANATEVALFYSFSICR